MERKLLKADHWVTGGRSHKSLRGFWRRGVIVFKNLTPHPIRFFDEDGEQILLEVPPAGVSPRLVEETRDLPSVGGVPAVETAFGGLEPELPPEEEGTVLIVSPLVLARVSGRVDVYAPDTGPGSVVRDGEGRILGVRRLRRYAQD